MKDVIARCREEGVTYLRGVLARGALLAIWAAACAALPAQADELAIAPAMLPDGMEGVPYKQTLFVEGGDQTSYQWREVHASWTTAACSYQVSANETPLWEGRKSSGNVEYVLPFAFPFGGKTYDKVYVGTHGFLFFKNASVDQTYPYNSDLYYYTGVAPFWCDTSNVEGYVDTNVANEVSFRFESFSTGTGTWAARVTLKSDGTIRYAYRQDGNTFNSDRTIGVGFSECGDYAYVGAETDGIPTNAITSSTAEKTASRGSQLRPRTMPNVVSDSPSVSKIPGVYRFMRILYHIAAPIGASSRRCPEPSPRRWRRGRHARRA